MSEYRDGLKSEKEEAQCLGSLVPLPRTVTSRTSPPPRLYTSFTIKQCRSNNTTLQIIYTNVLLTVHHASHNPLPNRPRPKCHNHFVPSSPILLLNKTTSSLKSRTLDHQARETLYPSPQPEMGPFDNPSSYSADPRHISGK